MIGNDRLDVTGSDEPEAYPEAARSDGRHEAGFGVRAEDDGHARRRLLERLEEGGLGVLVHPVGALDDGDPRATLGRHQHELGDEIADAAVLRIGTADDDLAPGPDRTQPVEVGVAPTVDQSARPTRPARSVGGLRRAQEAGRKIDREGRLPDAVRPDQQDGVRHRTPDHRSDRTERDRLSPGPGPVHAGAQTGSAGAAVLRVVRRFGAAPTAPSASPPGAAAALAAGLRVARGLAAGLAAATGVAAASDAASAAPAPLADAAAGLRVALGLAGALAVDAFAAAGLRVARGFGATVDGIPAASAAAGASPPRSATGSTGVETPAARLGAGFWATWARSSASSSGGTSLHGSFELCVALAGAGRSPRPRPRSSRCGGACCVRPLTSG